MKKTIGIAHRGFAGIAPENTLISFQKALEHKPDAVECDVHLSADGRLMVIHDETLERTTNGKGKVGEMTFTELRKLDAGSWYSKKYQGEKIPSLEELIDLVKGKTGLCVELKGKGTASKTVELIEKFNIIDKCSLFSFMPEEILLAKQLNPAISTLLLRYFDPKKPETLKPLEVAHQVLSSHANILGINKESVSPELIHLMHQRAITVGVYTVNTEEWMNKLINWDVDGIVSDYPDLLMNTLKGLKA